MSNDEIEEYKEVCAQLYQVIGWLLEECDMYDTVSGEKALDMASDAASGDPFERHRNILPWPDDGDLPGYTDLGEGL